MIKGLAHIGVAVNSIDESLAILAETFGAVEISPGGRKSFPEMGQTSALIQIGDDCVIELMEPYGEVEGTVTKFLKNHGPGLHHLSLETDDLEGTARELEEKNYRVIGMTPPDVKGDRLFFTHPKETSSIVFEVTQPGEE